jgi:uncharacterized membrane protein
MRQLHVITERLRSTLWPTPTVAALIAAAVAVALAAMTPQQPDWRWWPTDPLAAEGLMEVLAGSSLTVVALVFSLHVVALQLAASQYSPRLLRTYARDWIVQTAMAVLIATFVFCLVTLAAWAGMPVTPGFSVAVATVLGIASIAALVGVVAHIVASLRVETLMAGIHEDTAPVIDAAYGAIEQFPQDIPETRVTLRAPRSGFVQSVNRDRIARWAGQRRAFVLVEAFAGTHVLRGQALGFVAAEDHDVPRDLSDVADAVLLGRERTPEEDPGFGLAQLVDVAQRALGISVNDPTTARHAIGHLTAQLLQICGSGGGQGLVTKDSDGVVRVCQTLPTPAEHLRNTFRPLARSSGGEPEVVKDLSRLLDLVVECAPVLADEVRGHAEYLSRCIERDMADPADREEALERLSAHK